jgi:predicted DCC family thiol-disulfide oxidoreductase YuxK
LVLLQAGLYLIALPLDAAIGPGTATFFWTATLLFLAYVVADVVRARRPRPWLWAAFVTFVPVIGDIIYARTRAHRRTAVR